jgi:3-deoxy-manno-octulosonate cytidylyltransferase (CMP-KDO synthetase)
LNPATGIIPARYQSRRFPGKPLAPILGKPMIQWVYENAKKSSSLERLLVATDDKRIFKACQSFGADVIMTSPAHHSGTDRIAEAAQKVDSSIIVNIQGDEPLLQPDMIDSLVKSLQEDNAPMATLVYKTTDLASLSDENVVKVVFNRNGYALYFSRSPLPSHPQDFFFRHIGIYAYKKNFLMNFPHLPVLFLEKSENLEQLRALENGYQLKVIETPFMISSVDNPGDIHKIEEILKKEKHG